MPDLAEVAADPAPAGSFRHIAGDPRGDRRPILQQKDYCEDCQYQTDGLQHQRIERSGNAKPPRGRRNRVTKNRPESEPPDPDIEIVAHRLSTVRAADRIITIDRGRLAEDGTHEDLVRLG